MTAGHITRLTVFCRGWGKRWPLGVLGQVDGKLLFEYSPQAVARGLQFSPLRVPLPLPGAAQAAYTGPRHFDGLPGFIADSLPDGWGMLLMNRALRKMGRDPQSISALDRLAIVGERAMGALAFEPADAIEVERSSIVQIAALAREVQAVAAGANEGGSRAQLRRLLVLGGSPQGARPKALLRWNRSRDVFSPDAAGIAAGEPWLIKFPAQGERAEVCAIEALYAQLARGGGIEMPESAYFPLGSDHGAFGVRRFDRVDVGNGQELRVPLLSMAAALDADFRLPALDYETVLLATARITGDYRETLKAFHRCVFNVLTHNRDDHAKNFAFCMDAEGRWKLSPAFDLNFSHGPGGQHSTSVAGEGTTPGRRHLLQVAQRGGLKEKDARACIVHWQEALQPQPGMLEDFPIRQSTLLAMRKALDGVWKGLHDE
ncbi:MAG: HipA domain-containing protein [Burkholderiaceae bacterium]|jgi:serine/threonine-protein kinase HipA|nr:HipA domain-containing protein [Burkholderiaceae bacterium]